MRTFPRHVALHAGESLHEGAGLLQVTCSTVVCFFGLLAACRRKLPSLQVRVASGPACLTGLLWSIGNFLSIYAVQVRPSHPPATLAGTKHRTDSGQASRRAGTTAPSGLACMCVCVWTTNLGRLGLGPDPVQASRDG